MNREDVVRMARESGLKVGDNLSGITLVGAPSEYGLAHITLAELQGFAELVAAAEREDTVRCLEFHGYEDAIGYLNWRWRNRAGSDV